MILFKKDWNLYPGAIVDTQTTNESFLRLSALYEKMGVENYLFPLALLQPALQGVDPFADDLSDETKLAIALECRWNCWYAFREILRLPAQGGNDPIRFKANRANIALIWCFFNHVDFANIQPRQTGKSASTDCLWAYVLELVGINTTIQLVTKDNDLRKENVGRLKAIIDNLPAYLNPTTGKDADNKESVTCIVRGNKYLTAVGRSSKEAADNLGRGLTAAILHGDELPYIPNIQISLPVALASGTAARENAKTAGGLYGNIFTTTAGKKDSKGGRFAYNLIHDGMYWNESLLDSPNQEALVDTILRNSHSEAPIINGTFSHRQLGKTDAWLKRAIANARGTPDDVQRDFLNVWTSGTETSPLSNAILKVIGDSEMDPVYVQRVNNTYLMRWYVPEHELDNLLKRGQFIMGLDSSNAVGRDNNGLIITDASNMAVIGAASISEANLYRFAVWLGDLMIRYDNLILVIENKSSGQAIIDILLTILPHHGIDPFKRIYNRLVENIELYPSEEKMLNMPLTKRDEHFYLRNKAKFGFNTNGNSRAHLYGTVLQQAAKTTGHLVRDRVLSGELKGLVDKNGRVDHSEGGHDDSVIAWLLTHYFTSFSKNLKFYDVKHSLIMSDVYENGAIETDIDLEARRNQKKLRLEIESLKEMLSKEQTPSAKMRLEYALERKIKQSEVDGGTPVSLDTIMNEIKGSVTKKKTLKQALKKLRR